MIHPQPPHVLNKPHLAGDIYEPVVILRDEMVYVHHTARVDSFCKIEGGEGVSIGARVHVASFCHLNVGGGELIMEEGSCCASHCVIVTGSSQYGPGRGCSAVDPAVVVAKGRVVIGRNATLYAGCLVRPGVTIGEGATIAMGSVVLHDVPAGELWGGNPARPLTKQRVFIHGWTPEEERAMRAAGLNSESSGASIREFLNALRQRQQSALTPVDRFVDAQSEFYEWPESHA